MGKGLGRGHVEAEGLLGGNMGLFGAEKMWREGDIRKKHGKLGRRGQKRIYLSGEMEARAVDCPGMGQLVGSFGGSGSETD